MSSLARHRRRLTWTMLVASVVSVLLLGGFAYAGFKALWNYEGAKNVSEQLVPLPVSEVGMFATVDEDDVLTTITIFVIDSGDGVGGTAVTVPVAVDTAFGIDGQRIPLTEVYATSGPDALAQAVESVLTITLDAWTVADPGQAATVLSPVSPVSVELPADVLDGDPDDPTVVYEQGEVGLSAAQFVSVINARVEGEPEADRLPTVAASWVGVAEAVADGRTEVDATTPVVTFDDIATRLFAGPVITRVLATIPLAEDEVPEGVDVVALDRADATMVFASIAPSAMSAPTTGLVFRIEAPTGYDAEVKRAVEILLYFGQNVQSIYVSDEVPTQEITEIELYDATFEDRIEETQDLLGRIEIVEPEDKIAGVDVVLRLGTDYLEGEGVGDTLPSTTSTSTTAP